MTTSPEYITVAYSLLTRTGATGVLGRHMSQLHPSGADPGFLKGGGSISGADTGFPEGGGETFTSTPPPWTLSAWRHPPSEKLKTPPLLDIHKHPSLDIVRVTSSTLRKIKKHPHSWTFTSTPPPPLDIARVTSSTFQGGDRSRSRTLCIGFQYRDKFKGGGVITPVTHPPTPGSATASYS